MIYSHYADVCEPYEFEKENAQTGELEVVKKLTDIINSDKSLLNLVKAFGSGQKREEEDDEDEDAEESSEEELEFGCNQLNQELQAQQQQAATILQ
mmetsp:Transcript_8131/g.6069  ORF Transcript_8131/g.6069 Transcript_8131/m.6069 type:complete len:96 (+) Transcript_8131:487-774(+)